MRFIIKETEKQAKAIVVTEDTTVGVLKGIWRYAQAPVIGEEYHIELQIDDPLELNVHCNRKSHPSVSLSGEDVIFKGRCEDADSDVYYIRFDIDWLEMIEIFYLASQKKAGNIISFSARYYNITIYPYTI